MTEMLSNPPCLIIIDPSVSSGLNDDLVTLEETADSGCTPPGLSDEFVFDDENEIEIGSPCYCNEELCLGGCEPSQSELQSESDKDSFCMLAIAAFVGFCVGCGATSCYIGLFG